MDTWGLRKTLGAIGVAAAVAGVGGAAIAAATDGGHAFPEGMMHAPGGPGGPGGPPPAAAPRVADATAGSLHAEYVVADGAGGFVTKLTQTGRVTAISPTSITARSDDGFTQTYAIREVGGAAPPPFSIGDLLVIGATRAGPTVEVQSLQPPLAPGH